MQFSHKVTSLLKVWGSRVQVSQSLMTALQYCYKKKVLSFVLNSHLFQAFWRTPLGMEQANDSQWNLAYPEKKEKQHLITDIQGEQGRQGGKLKRSPPSNVSQIWSPDLASYVGWVCCWFSSLVLEVFLWVFQFPLSSKTNISTFPFNPRMQRHFKKGSCELLGAPWANKLHMYIYFI